MYLIKKYHIGRIQIIHRIIILKTKEYKSLNHTKNFLNEKNNEFLLDIKCCKTTSFQQRY